MAIEIQKIQKKQEENTNTNVLGNQSRIIGFLSKDIKLFGKTLSDKKKEGFYSELSILLTSGIDIRSALDIIVAEQKKEQDKKLFLGIRESVINGNSLSEAIHKTSKFSPYEYHSLRIGEESGKIKEILADLNIYFSKKIKQKRQIVSALTYPSLVLLTALVAVIFMMNFIVPMFMDVFKRFNGQIPAITQTIINISAFFRAYSLLIIFIIISLIIIIFSFRKRSGYRAFSSGILLKFPIFGEITQKIYLTRFCQTMALLLGARTPMLKSINLVQHMIGFYPYEIALKKIEDDILHGRLLHQSLEQFKLFDNRVVSLVKVAEEVNQLDVIFGKLSVQYNEELEHKISLLSSMLEPVMIIFVGILVATILISMYLPLFQLSTSVY